ncbi:hypothetical protein Tcan_02432 [Toxocara canis]|uniref:Uncharacterized protein n=1 Tax=Toxocara canis TaxID=6265 RepID=A0A0B2UJD7_TOXCA|nr:hypothetical protein Tcan_02432 [Toxocara canis]
MLAFQERDSVVARVRITALYCSYLLKVYEGRPELDLGDEQKSYCIGSLKSPYGTISLELRYRTKMEIERSLKHPEGKENACPKKVDSCHKANLIKDESAFNTSAEFCAAEIRSPGFP